MEGASCSSDDGSPPHPGVTCTGRTSEENMVAQVPMHQQTTGLVMRPSLMPRQILYSSVPPIYRGTGNKKKPVSCRHLLCCSKSSNAAGKSVPDQAGARISTRLENAGTWAWPKQPGRLEWVHERSVKGQRGPRSVPGTPPS